MALTKNFIVEQMQNQLGFPKNQSTEITESLLEIIKSTLQSGDDLLVSGFGTRIEHLINSLAYLRFKGDLAKPVVRSGAGGFSIEEDEHG